MPDNFLFMWIVLRGVILEIWAKMKNCLRLSYLYYTTQMLHIFIIISQTSLYVCLFDSSFRFCLSVWSLVIQCLSQSFDVCSFVMERYNETNL